LKLEVAQYDTEFCDGTFVTGWLAANNAKARYSTYSIVQVYHSKLNRKDAIVVVEEQIQGIHPTHGY